MFRRTFFSSGIWPPGKECIMTRLLALSLLTISLAFFTAPQVMAEEQAQPTLIKVYKAPG
jgi:hypothetical protein